MFGKCYKQFFTDEVFEIASNLALQPPLKKQTKFLRLDFL